MSGDVQPRKRKEKRRKKDDEDTGTPPPTLISPADTSTENVTIHIYKESSTGGHWCARIIFFILLAALVGLIGVIIFEHRGTTDVDIPVASSQWASIFEGWVDDASSDHDHDASHNQEEAAEEEESKDEEEDHDEEESTEVEKEEKEEEEKSIEQSEEDEGIGEEEDEELEETEEEDDEEDQQEEEEEEEQEEEEEAQEDSAEAEETDEDRSQEDQEEDEGIDEAEDDDAQDTGILEEIDETNGDEDDEESNIPDDFDVELDDDTELADDSEEKNDVSEEFTGIPGVNEIDDSSADPLEEIESEEPEEDINDADNEPEEEEIEEESTSVAAKFGIGVALVVAAHFVLIRRWNNVDTPDLSRRNTIILPPHIKQVIKSAEKAGNKTPIEAQVKTYEDLKSKYKKLQEENVSPIDVKKLTSQDKTAQAKSARKTAKEEIDTSRDQSKVISSEEEEEDYELEASAGERVSKVEEHNKKQVEDDEGKEEEEEEEEEAEEEEEEEEEEIENVDDSELIAKLEAKYGKLPTPQDSEVEEEEEEEEEEEDEEEEEEEEEEQEDEIPQWKRVKEVKDLHVESQAKRPIQQTKMETKQSDSSQSNNEKALNNISHIDDIIVYEENDSVELQIDKEFYN